MQLTAQDREKIIELMLSQERVLSLLYEKTIPSRLLHVKPLEDLMNLTVAMIKYIDYALMIILKFI